MLALSSVCVCVCVKSLHSILYIISHFHIIELLCLLTKDEISKFLALLHCPHTHRASANGITDVLLLNFRLYLENCLSEI